MGSCPRSYGAGKDQVWGIQLRRAVRRKNEWAYLTPVPQILAGPQAFNRISTGGTLMRAAHALKERGAREIMACITHAVFADSVFEKLERSEITSLTVTNTINHDPKAISARTQKVEILSVARILGEALHRIHSEESLSSLFI